MQLRIAKVVFLILLFTSFKDAAQYYIGEYQDYDCTYSKEIVIPFDYNKLGGTIKNPPLNQIVFYSHRDQFSYWYKVITKESSIINLKVDPVDVRDNYTVFIYKYNKDDFCDKVYHQKIDPAKSSFFLNVQARENPYNLSEKSFLAEKDNTYYISILNVSINNCGHVLKLYKANAKDTLKIRALHIPCVRDVSIAANKIDLNAMFSSDLKIRQDTIKKPVASTENVNDYLTINCEITSAAKGKITNPKLRIIDELTGNEVAIIPSSINDEFKFKIEKEKSYKVECSAFGYKHFDKSIRINDHLDGSENSFTVKLNPLKVGDNFVVKNIYFHPNTYALRKESEPDLAKLLSYLLANEKVSIEIQGHTNGNNKIYKNRAYASLGKEWDFSGSAKKLSQKRADGIKKYLIENGVNEKRLMSKGYGGDRLIIQNPVTLEEGQKNIRVEVVIVNN